MEETPRERIRREEQDRTEANEPVGAGKRHVPYAQMTPEEQKKKSPGKEEHDAAGQGLSG